MSHLLQVAVDHFLPILIANYGPAILTALGALVTYLLHKHVKSSKVLAAWDWLREHVGPVVAAVEQTYVDAVTKNGTVELTDAQKDEALKRALDAILAQIPAEYLALLRQIYPKPGDLEAVLTTLIEGAVKQLELQRKAGVKLTALALPAKGSAMARPEPIIPPPPAGFEDVPGLTNEKASGR
jgi:hypothetical protein